MTMPAPSSTAFEPRWPLGLRRMHALMALGLAATFGMGVAMTRGGLDAGLRFDLYQLHKSFGIAMLAMLVARAALRLKSRPPSPIGPRWRASAAAAVHAALYACLFALPLVGWAMASTSPLPIPTVVFGLFTLPALLAPDPALHEALKLSHRLLGWTLASLLVAHVAGALTHRGQRLVSRMWTVRSGGR
jgi:cytochrome b561